MELAEVVTNYPNYNSPGDPWSRVWGDNLQRLFQIKLNYDPLCTITKGRSLQRRAAWQEDFPISLRRKPDLGSYR